MKKRIFVFLSLLLTISLLSAQDELPTFISLSVSPDTIKNGEYIETTVIAYDSISGIDKIGVSIFNPLGEFVEQLQIYSDVYIGNNVYKDPYQISKWAISGVYKLADIVVVNNASDILSISSELDSFVVVSSSPDTTAPTINILKVYPDTLEILEQLNIEFEAKDDVSGLYVLRFSLYNSKNDLVDYEVLHFNGNDIPLTGPDRYIISRTIPEDAIKGNWHWGMSITDSASNSFYFDDTTNIFVNGIYQDVTPPVINSVNVYPDTIDLLDSLYIRFEAEDPESGLHKLYVLIMDDLGNNERYRFDFNTPEVKDLGQNMYLIAKQITPLFEKGYRSFKIQIYDNNDNSTFHNSASKIFITDQLDSTKLHIDNYGPTNQQISVYPNPFNNIVSIQSKHISYAKLALKIYNTHGQLIIRRDIDQKCNIDMSSFPNGLYYFVINTNNIGTSAIMIKE